LTGIIALSVAGPAHARFYKNPTKSQVGAMRRHMVGSIADKYKLSRRSVGQRFKITEASVQKYGEHPLMLIAKGQMNAKSGPSRYKIDISATGNLNNRERLDRKSIRLASNTTLTTKLRIGNTTENFRKTLFFTGGK
jgi:hypothetical protein